MNDGGQMQAVLQRFDVLRRRMLCVQQGLDVLMCVKCFALGWTFLLCLSGGNC